MGTVSISVKWRQWTIAFNHAGAGAGGWQTTRNGGGGRRETSGWWTTGREGRENRCDPSEGQECWGRRHAEWRKIDVIEIK